MSSEEFHRDLDDVVKRHAADLDADDLMQAADRLQRQAEKWEVLENV